MRVVLAIVGLLVLYGLISGGSKPQTPTAPASASSAPPPTITVPTNAPASPTAISAVSPQGNWRMVAQFKGADDRMSTRVFTTNGPWRLTWLTYYSLEVVVLQSRTVRNFGEVNEYHRPGPPTVGNLHVAESGDFFLVIRAIGYYQIDIEEPR